MGAGLHARLSDHATQIPYTDVLTGYQWVGYVGRLDMIAAFFGFSNRMAGYMDMRPNAEFYTMGRAVPGSESR